MYQRAVIDRRILIEADSLARKQHDGISDQKKASLRRRSDAQALLEARCWRGAMYLGGYAVECLLKASLMAQFGCHTLADLDETLKDRRLLAINSSVYTHQFEILFRVAGHLDRLQQDQRLWKMFNTVNRWLPAWRYSPDLAGPNEAESFLKAVDQITTWINANI